MTRTADEMITHQIDAIMRVDMDSILSDYDQDLVAITHLNGRTKTAGFDTLAILNANSAGFASKLGLGIERTVAKLHVLFRQSAGDYAVLLASLKPFTPFASFTFITRDGKAAYVTGFAKTIKLPALGIAPHPFAPGQETMAAVERHLHHLKTRNLAAAADDYAEDAVVITNLAQKPFSGRGRIAEYCRGLMCQGERCLTALTADDVKYKVRQAAAELGCVAFQHRASKKYGVQTYLVSNGKIAFESAVFSDQEPVIFN